MHTRPWRSKDNAILWLTDDGGKRHGIGPISACGLSGLPEGAAMPQIETAVALMRMALALLDAAGELNVAVQLQHAINVATNEQPMQPGEEIPPEVLERFLGPAPQ